MEQYTRQRSSLVRQDAPWVVWSPPDERAPAGHGENQLIVKWQRSHHLSMYMGNSFCLLVGWGEWANVCYLCQKLRASFKNATVTSTPGRCHMRQLSQHLACALFSSDILTGCQDSKPHQGDAILLRELVTLDLSPQFHPRESA